ncbi:formylglycine-generating enzyme family protein [Cronobacter turicensis]|uniref:formylglycine-generating enzyme family protein n=1 Tax=Cronobacter turicensis TaxID=413502 RepID=UPI0024C2A9A4|nr:SUMF1/EgtB/PvdO family nonheme iron enzyme [Cronobacter turicensis]MDK1234757.1 SUMF1/EgtB/PvdO family nonheme iron enzyme [Cronobacter turicensis]
MKADLVYVKGGTFWMGDFCKKMRDGGPYCSSEKDTRPLHEVELSSYSIGKFKVTHEDYSFYLKMAGLPAQHFEKEWRNEILAEMTHFKNSPAIVTWTEADNYCTWLKNETGLPFSLPTEAQWEYAACSRGQYILVATDNGIWQEDKNTSQGENYATDEDRRKVEENSGINSTSVHFPVDKYPPTPFGLYGMADNGYEWAKDWYDPNYYNISPKKDPQGPEKPVIKDVDTGQYRKSLRGGNHPAPSGNVGLTFFRGYNIPNNDFPNDTTVRCVVNSPEPIK